MSVAGTGFEEFMASNRSHISKGEETIDTHEARNIRGTTVMGVSEKHLREEAQRETSSTQDRSTINEGDAHVAVPGV